MNQKIHDLAYRIAHEVRHLGEFDQGKECTNCKQCLYQLKHYLDEFILLAILNEDNKQ